MEIGEEILIVGCEENEDHPFIPTVTGIIRDIRHGRTIVEFTSGIRDGEFCSIPLSAYFDDSTTL